MTLAPTTTTTAQYWREAALETVGSWKQMFTGRTVLNNVTSGVTVAFVALPLNLALAMACGLPPAVGLISGVIASVVAGLLGGQKVQISGPEVALAPLTFEIVSRHGFTGLVVATFFSGVLQIVFGAARVGRLIHAIPRPVVGGFLAAVGLLVLDAQLPRLLGLPSSVRLMSGISPHDSLSQADLASLVLGGVVMGFFLFLPRVNPRLPGGLAGLVVVAVAIAVVGARLPMVGTLELTGVKFGLPDFAAVDAWALVPEGIALALLSSIDSLLCAVSLDTVTRSKRHRSDQELVAQGLANIASSFFGGMPVAGAVVRSMAAVQSGGTTRLVSLVQAGALLVMLLVAAPLVATIPLTGLAGILLVVGYRLINWRELRFMWGVSRLEALIFLATAVSILLGDFVSGVATGLVLSMVHFAVQHRRLALSAHRRAPGGAQLQRIGIVEINGPIFFASHTELESLVGAQAGGDLILDLRQVPLIDLTGADALRVVVEQLEAQQTRVLMVGAREEVAYSLAASGVLEKVVGQRMFANVDDALRALHRAEAPAPEASPPRAYALNPTAA